MAREWLTRAEALARWGTDRVQRIAAARGSDLDPSDVIDAALADAHGRAESKLLARYQPGDLPDTAVTTSPTLKRIVGGLFWWYLHDHQDVRGEDVTSAMKGALDELTDVARGGASLVLSGDPEVDLSAPQILSSTKTAKGTFTDESLEDW